MYEKMVQDGKVAVLYSPDYGAGWYSWNEQHPGLLFDKEIVEAVLGGDYKQAINIAQQKYKDAYTNGGYSLQVKWVPEGTQFYIKEYDGSERVVLETEHKFITA